MALLDVVFRLLDKSGASFVEPRREDGHGSSAGTPTHVTLPNSQVQIDSLTNDQLRASPVAVSGTVALDSASLIALENVTVNVEAGASVGVNNFPAEYPLPAAQVIALSPLAVQPVSGTVQARDAYSGGETLSDQVGNGSAVTFTFSSPVQLVYAQIKTGLGTAQGRADPFGGIPASSTGIPLDDGVPQAMPVTTDTVRVFAPIGATVSVWGYRYG